MSNIDKESNVKMTAGNEKDAKNQVPVKLQPIPGCVRCRPQPGKGAPTWFYRSKSGSRLPAITMQDLENDQRYGQMVSEEQRLSRVQEWLRKSFKGGSMGELDRIGEEVEAKRKSNREIMEDARKWYQKKATRTNETLLFSEPSGDGLLPKPVRLNNNQKLSPVNIKNTPLEPVYDQRSVDSNSAISSSVLKTYKDLFDHKQGPLPKDDALRHYFEKKKMVGNYKVDRTFTNGLHTKEKSLCRNTMGPIGRPHTPVMSLANRQRSTIGDEAWFDRSRKKQSMTDIRRMQSRTYELQSQLQQMLDKQQRG